MALSQTKHTVEFSNNTHTPLTSHPKTTSSRGSHCNPPPARGNFSSVGDPPAPVKPGEPDTHTFPPPEPGPRLSAPARSLAAPIKLHGSVDETKSGLFPQVGRFFTASSRVGPSGAPLGSRYCRHCGLSSKTRCIARRVHRRVACPADVTMYARPGGGRRFLKNPARPVEYGSFGGGAMLAPSNGPFTVVLLRGYWRALVGTASLGEQASRDDHTGPRAQGGVPIGNRCNPWRPTPRSGRGVKGGRVTPPT